MNYMNIEGSTVPESHCGPSAIQDFGGRQSGPMRVEFKTDLEQLPPLEKDWEALNRRCSDHDAPFFQCFAWNHYVASVRARCNQGRYKLLVATVWRENELVGVWPLAQMRHAGTWMVRSLDYPFGQMAGVVFKHTGDIEPGVSAILSELRGRADGLQIEGVIAGSALHTALAKQGATIASAQRSVVVNFAPYSTFDAFEQGVKGSTRKVLRKRAQKMRKEYAVEDILVDDKERMKPLLLQVFDARCEWLRRNGRTSAAFRDDTFRTLIVNVAQVEGIELLGFALATQAAAIAAQWGFSYAGKFYAYMSSKNADFDEFSPGRLLYRLVIESCYKRGIKALELMPPASDEKLEWSASAKQVETLTMPFTMRGRVALLVLHSVIPLFQRLSRKLPERLRRPLVAGLNRS